MIGSDASAVGALVSSSAFSPLYGLCMALVVNLHTVRYVSFVKAVTEFVSHLTGLPWPLAVVAVSVSRASLALIQPTAVIGLDYLPHEALKLHLVDGPVCFPHFFPTRAGCLMLLCCGCVALAQNGLYTSPITDHQSCTTRILAPEELCTE